jgi:thioredoxin reductase (NADPH)
VITEHEVYLVNSIFQLPTDVTLFSMPDLLEIGGIPFIISKEKPQRTDLLDYYLLKTQGIMEQKS